MNYAPLHRYFIYDGVLTPNGEFRHSENAGGIYEVIRVVDSIPLFLEDHLDRFYHSAGLAGKSIRFSREEIVLFIADLITGNRISAGNILLSCKDRLKAFFIPHAYPEEAWYTTGIDCGLLHAERENPNAKIFQTTVRQKADALIEQHGYYEVLLVDTSGHVTEGSRSNLFFIQGDTLVTSPGRGVLLGITRQKVIRLAAQSGMPFREAEIRLNDLSRFEAAFITGTSPKVLPVATIDSMKFDAGNSYLQRIRRLYDDLIAGYISSHR